MAIPRRKVRLRRWLVSIGLAAIIALAGLLLLVRVKFEGPDLGDGLSAMLNQRMRGRIAIGSVDWPMSALKTAVTGGWVAVTMRDVEVYDDKDEPVLVTPRITADLDLHALMFGRHDFVLRNIEVTGGRVLLREISDPYPLHDYDKTVFSILAAFYSKRSAAGYYVGVQATTAPLFDLQNYRLHDVDVDIRMTPYGKDDTSYQVRALLEDLNVSGGFLYMDSSDPLVPKFYFSLKPEAAGGEIDLFYEPRAAGGYTSTYQIPIKSLKVNSLAQLPAAWPTSSVANTLTFDVDITTADDAVMHVGGAMRDYWVDAYDGTWDVVATVKNAGPMLRHTFDPDLGGDNVTVAATITGPIVAYPKIAATLTGLTYNVTLVEPPLLLELETLKVEYDLVVDRGSVEEFVARGAGGKVKISGTFGGDGSDEAPFKVDGQVDIEEAVDLRGRMPPCLEQAFGSEVSGHLRVHRDKGDTALNVVVEDFVLDIGRLTVSGGSVFSDIAFGAINLDAVRLQFQHTNGLVWGSVNTATGKLDLDADARSGDIGGLVNQLNCATPKPKPARKEVQGRPGLAIAPRRTSRPPTVTPRARAVAAAPTAARAPVQGQPAPTPPRPPPAPAPTPKTPRPPPTSGDVRIHIGGTIDAPVVQATGRLAGVPVVDVLRGNIVYEGDTVTVDATSPGLGGPLRAVGTVHLAPVTSIDRMRVTAQKIDLAKLPAGLAGVGGRAWADLTMQGQPTLRGLRVAGWACSPKVSLGGDGYSNVGLWLDRAPTALKVCDVAVPDARTSSATGAQCIAVTRAGGRCAIATARRDAGGDITIAASIDRSQRLGGAITVHDLPLAALAALAETTLPAGALLDADQLELGGTVAAPQLTGAIGFRRAWFQRAHLGDGVLAVRADQPGFIAFDSALLDGRVAVHGRVGTALPYPLELTVDLDQLELDTFVDTRALGLPDATRAWTSGRISVRTALADPNAPLTASGELTELSVSTSMPGPDGEPVPLTVRTAAPLRLEYDGKEARIVDTAVFTTPLGPITIEGRISALTVELAARGGLDLARAQPLIGRYFDQTSGIATLDARVSGATAAPRVQASIDLTDVGLHLARQDATLRIPRGRIDLSDRALSFTGLAVEVDDGFSQERPTLTVAGAVALKGLAPVRWGVIVEGELAGEMLLAAAPAAFAQASGTADITLTLAGTGPVPTISGELTFDRNQPLTVLPRSLRREISLTEGSLSFSAEELTLEGVGGTVDDEGRLRGIDGTIDLRNGRLGGAVLTASADALPFRFGRALDLVLDVQDLRVQLDEAGNLAIGGGVTVVDGRFIQNFDLGEFLRPAAAAAPAAPPIWDAWPPLGNARLAIDVDVRKFTALSNLFTLDALGAIAITGTPRDPRLGGTIQIASGTIRLPGIRARFTRTTGRASFSPLVPMASATIELSVTSEADYRDPSGQDHLVTLRLEGALARLAWDLGTTSGLNKAQTLTLLFSGKTPEQFQASLGSQAIGADPTKIDPSTDTSQGYTDELVRQITADYLTRGIADTLRDLSGLDVARIEINLASFGFHGEKRLFEKFQLIGDLERTTRGSTLNGQVEWHVRPQLGVQGTYLRKDYDDAAERDVKDFEIKLVYHALVRRLFGP